MPLTYVSTILSDFMFLSFCIHTFYLGVSYAQWVLGPLVYYFAKWRNDENTEAHF